MKKFISVFIAFAMLFLSYSAAYAENPGTTGTQKVVPAKSKKKCTTIRSGKIKDSAGNPVKLGNDQFGYNYQAHKFNGTYDGYDRVLDGKVWGVEVDYADDKLIMKWSDSWLSNLDCNGDGLLDRGLVNGVSDGISKGWLTNHANGDYLDANGASHHYTDFVKIVYVEEGGDLWNYYTIIQEVYNDPYGGHTRFRTDPGLGQH